MNEPDAPQLPEPLCGVCQLPIGNGETGLRHFGWYTAHAEARCVYLLKARAEQAERELAELRRYRDDMHDTLDKLAAALGTGRDADALIAKAAELRRERDALHALLNTPETEDFLRGVELEAAHQVERWGDDHDRHKEPQDWFWTLGYLGGKALNAIKAGDLKKAKHHIITSAALLKNWHRHILAAGPMVAGLSAPVERLTGAALKSSTESRND